MNHSQTVCACSSSYAIVHLSFSWWSVEGSPSYGPWISKKRVFVFCPQHNFGIFWWIFLKLCVCVHHNMPLCTCHFHDDLLRGPQVMALELVKKRVFVFCPQHNFGMLWWIFLKLCVCVHHHMPLCTCHFHDDRLRGPRVMALELVKKGCLCFVRSITLASFDEFFSNCVYVFIIICHCAPAIFMMIC